MTSGGQLVNESNFPETMAAMPDSIRNRIRFVLADHIDEVLKESLSELVVPGESSLEAAVDAIQDKDER